MAIITTFRKLFTFAICVTLLCLIFHFLAKMPYSTLKYDVKSYDIKKYSGYTTVQYGITKQNRLSIKHEGSVQSEHIEGNAKSFKKSPGISNQTPSWILTNKKTKSAISHNVPDIKKEGPRLILQNMLELFKGEFKKLESYREDILRQLKGTNITFIRPMLYERQYKVVAMGENHFKKIEKYKGVKTVNFSLPYQRISKLWPYKVYQPVLSKNVTYRTHPLPGGNYKHALEKLGPPKFFFLQTTAIRRENDDVLLTFIHIIQNGVVFKEGIVAHGDIHINHHGCKYESYQKTESVDALPTHREIFTTSQFWGAGVFHSAVENIPRLALYVDFLRQNPSILIHCRGNKSYTVNFIRQLGLSNTIISGHAKAHIIYMPAGVGCGVATTFPSFILNLRLRGIYEDQNTERRSVVVIKRSVRRWFDRHTDIWNMLLKHQKTYGYKLELFSDKKMPNFKETAKMFNRALMVIGPHGAGLSNILFSQPGTVVVEGTCKLLNTCYRRLAHVLNQIYYGIIPKRDCFDTTPETIEKVVLPYFEWLKSTNAL